MANNFHNQLIISTVSIEDPVWEFAGQQIHEKEHDSFAQLVSKWNNQLNLLYKKLNNKIQNDIGVSIKQLDYYMEQKQFIEAYINYYKTIFCELLDENNENFEDLFIINFIQMKLDYLQCNKSIKIKCQENLTMPFFTFGADQDGHVLLINSDFYTPEIIQYVYELAEQDNYKFYITPQANYHESRVIEYSNLLHCNIAQAVSQIMHQGDYFSKLLIYFIFNKKSTSEEIQDYGDHYNQFRSLLEACLQSKNPLEVAIYFEPQLDSLSQEFVLLWREFIEDIKDSYDVDDLKAYEAMSRYERQSHLYTFQDNDEN